MTDSIQLARELERYKTENERLKNALGRAKGHFVDKIGPGYWGLVHNEGDVMSHDEIVFLFARIYRMLGFESISLIKQTYPDCTAIKDGEKIYIEFEPKLSRFDHFQPGDLEKLTHIVCWEDDLSDFDFKKQGFKDNHIEIIELKKLWEEWRISSKSQFSHVWTERDIEGLLRSRPAATKILRILFEKKQNEWLTKDQLKNEAKIKDKGISGALHAFFQRKGKDDLLEKELKEEETGALSEKFRLKSEYRSLIERILRKNKLI